MAYCKVNTDRMAGSWDGSKLISFKYLPGDTATAIENGNVVLVGALVSGSREVFDCETPAANSAIGNIALVATPEIDPDERKKGLNEFRNEIGAIGRAYRLCSGDVFSVTAEGLTEITGTAPAAGQVVELQANTKLKLVASATPQSTTVGSVLEVVGDWITILVA